MLWLSGSNLETKLYPDCVVAKIVGLEQNVERWFDFCKAPMEVIGIDPMRPALITWVSTSSCCYQWQDCQGCRSVFISAVSSDYCEAVKASQRNAVQMYMLVIWTEKKNIEEPTVLSLLKCSRTLFVLYLELCCKVEIPSYQRDATGVIFVCLFLVLLLLKFNKINITWTDLQYDSNILKQNLTSEYHVSFVFISLKM